MRRMSCCTVWQCMISHATASLARRPVCLKLMENSRGQGQLTLTPNIMASIPLAYEALLVLPCLAISLLQRTNTDTCFGIITPARQMGEAVCRGKLQGEQMMTYLPADPIALAGGN